MQFVYNQIPNKLDLFDYDTFQMNEIKMYAVVSNLETGKQRISSMYQYA